MRATSGLLALSLVLSWGCSSRIDEMTVYPLDEQLASLDQPRDAVKRFEADFRVKRGTGSYKIFAINGLDNDCFQVIARPGTELGVRPVHASREDGDVLYC